MALLFGQLLYTSFPEEGFKVLTSPSVPADVREAFLQRIVYRYWDCYSPPDAGHRSVYLHQVSPEHCLFGWLYGDGTDDLGRSHVPTFICYHLTGPLQAVQLENVFACLHRGPVGWVESKQGERVLEAVAAPDLWNYSAARMGVGVPAGVYERGHCALETGELIDLFFIAEPRTLAASPTHDEQSVHGAEPGYSTRTASNAPPDRSIAKVGWTLSTRLVRRLRRYRLARAREKQFRTALSKLNQSSSEAHSRSGLRLHPRAAVQVTLIIAVVTVAAWMGMSAEDTQPKSEQTQTINLARVEQARPTLSQPQVEPVQMSNPRQPSQVPELIEKPAQPQPNSSRPDRQTPRVTPKRASPPQTSNTKASQKQASTRYKQKAGIARLRQQRTSVLEVQAESDTAPEPLNATLRQARAPKTMVELKRAYEEEVALKESERMYGLWRKNRKD
ncbi:MAG: hypothetical protein H7Y22_09115, partial [Gemmatimonadaceae bacterium]|nr:hypothetical protein [Gloeobacterales cyanobacterium ES-bin-141]